MVVVEAARGPTDLWPWYKELSAVVEAAIVDKQPGVRPRLEAALKKAKPAFTNLLKNPPPTPADAELLKKATQEVQMTFFEVKLVVVLM